MCWYIFSYSNKRQAKKPHINVILYCIVSFITSGYLIVGKWLTKPSSDWCHTAVESNLFIVRLLFEDVWLKTDFFFLRCISNSGWLIFLDIWKDLSFMSLALAPLSWNKRNSNLMLTFFFIVGAVQLPAFGHLLYVLSGTESVVGAASRDKRCALSYSCQRCTGCALGINWRCQRKWRNWVLSNSNSFFLQHFCICPVAG